MESHISKYRPVQQTTHRCESIPQLTRTPNNRNATPKTAYWYETATTLSSENADLTEKVTKYEERCRTLTGSVTRLSQLRTALEKDLATANKEIIRLTACTHPTLPPTPNIPSKSNSISVSTQGRDAMHWYQTCRSMEAQYIQMISELETRVSQLTETITSNTGKRPRRIDNKRDRQTPITHSENTVHVINPNANMVDI